MTEALIIFWAIVNTPEAMWLTAAAALAWLIVIFGPRVAYRIRMSRLLKQDEAEMEKLKGAGEEWGKNNGKLAASKDARP
jgi:hypothetical protein